LYEVARLRLTPELADELISQWPSITVQCPIKDDYATHFNLDPINTIVVSKFGSWFRNKAFKEFIENVQRIINRLRPSQDITKACTVLSDADTMVAPTAAPSMNWRHLFECKVPVASLVDELDLSSLFKKALVVKDYHRTQKLLDRML
jgi:hypothetical protein